MYRINQKESKNRNIKNKFAPNHISILVIQKCVNLANNSMIFGFSLGEVRFKSYLG